MAAPISVFGTSGSAQYTMQPGTVLEFQANGPTIVTLDTGERVIARCAGRLRRARVVAGDRVIVGRLTYAPAHGHIVELIKQ